MNEHSKPDPENTGAGTGPREDRDQKENETAERVESFSRRALIEAGWALPVILSVVLPERVLAQSRVFPVFHLDQHFDHNIHVHSDAPFTDDTAHNDNPHGDSPHGDVHTDSGPPPVHVDAIHGDGFIDGSFADGGFADHLDASPAHHTDNAHIDQHSDRSFPNVPSHVDVHADFPHLDFAVNVHGDHSDGQPPHPGGGAFTDHTDGFCRTTHGDNNHGDENTHVDHYDITPNTPLHDDHCDTQGGHADMQIGHIDAHADRHADVRHSDAHLDFTIP